MAKKQVMIKLVYQDKACARQSPPDGFTFLKDNQKHSLKHIMRAYIDAGSLLKNDKLPDKQKLQLEKYRLALMEAIYQSLPTEKAPAAQIKNNNAPEPHKHSEKKSLWQKIQHGIKVNPLYISIFIGNEPEDADDTDESTKKKTPWEKFKHSLKLGMLLFAAFMGLAETAIWTYFGAIEAIMVVVPIATIAICIPIAIAFTAIAVIQFLGFEVDQVKQMFGIKFSSQAQELFSIYERQIKLAGQFNKTLLNNVHCINGLSKYEYHQYASAAAKFNDDVKQKQDTFKKYKEPRSKKALRYGMTFVGMILVSMEVYLGTTLLLGSFMAPILGTPIGWAFIAAFIGAYLIFFLSMRGSGLDSLFNTISAQSKVVREKLDKFIPKSMNDFKNVLLNKSFFAKQYFRTESVKPVSFEKKKQNDGKLPSTVPKPIRINYQPNSSSHFSAVQSKGRQLKEKVINLITTPQKRASAY